MIKGIIFDFDGVLVESDCHYVDSLVKYYRSKGYDAKFDEIKAVVGRNRVGIATLLKEIFNLNESIEEIIKTTDEYFLSTCSIEEFEPVEGAIEFVNKVYEKGLRLCIASSSDVNYVTKLITKFNIKDKFEFIVSGSNLKRGKPYPDIYNLAQEKMGIPKDELLVIEDSVAGIQAGIASNIKTVGFKGSFIKQDTSHADIEINNFKELDNILFSKE